MKVQTFPILPKKISFQLKKLTKSSARAYWKEAPGATGYEILYSSTEKGSYQSIGYHQSLDCIVEKLEFGYIYYFNIRPYVYIGSKLYYGGLSKVVSIKM
ncbi:MAG: hypothetical protein H6Q59_1877 [Firmicutes bacterium]|nr:hypothetical protein [Bacillota bacterium]